jgi:CheY-like chemotaxis protein
MISAAARASPRLAGASLLVVDDEALLTSLLAEECLELGATRAFEAHDGHSALAVLKTEPDIAVMICDIRMPGMDGTELARHALAMRPDLKVLFVTGYSAGLETGRWPVLDKPVEPALLERELCRLLGR